MWTHTFLMETLKHLTQFQEASDDITHWEKEVGLVRSLFGKIFGANNSGHISTRDRYRWGEEELAY